MTFYVFVTGGVVSSLGKGIMMSALGSLLQTRTFNVCLRKLDPYLNIDPGTMNPLQHGEVYVSDDGIETDLDLGHYERFTGVPATRKDNITAGRIYKNILQKERRGDYLGSTVQVVPHVTEAIKDFILDHEEKLDFLLCEIGGTVGDIESLPFLEAIRQMRNDLGSSKVCFVHTTLVPYIPSVGELKTKPTQHSVKELRSIGIQPDVLVCRSVYPIPKEQKKKMGLFCNVPEDAVIEALDTEVLYDIPCIYHKAGLDTQVLQHFQLLNENTSRANLRVWENVSYAIHNALQSVTIALVGKYTSLHDSYLSLKEALVHGGLSSRTRVIIKWINAEEIQTQEDCAELFSNVHGILVPGGFGARGVGGKIQSITFARTHNIPYLGICFGMQMAVVEFARNVLGLKKAHSTELEINTSEPVVALIEEWAQDNDIIRRCIHDDKGGSMRLGSCQALLKTKSKLFSIYKEKEISERHRHRYEINGKYIPILESKGLMFSGFSPDGLLVESIEIPTHRWFVGVQYHPELKSKPFSPHPLFVAFVGSVLEYSQEISSEEVEH